ncbi:hypothetical protein SAMN05444000_1065 [Shimia gijangensis]|uniref:Uncharacterized protein n=1 Tax=Shimia gijangensis TaxID=1470563 RepID=A0A1M6HBI1_9RHOB|nr:hypothetical protein [Shimia gijangensis]SHJ19552.1 hypothetical protein SAMN05444000_1065 [Shimia gijangensis]
MMNFKGNAHNRARKELATPRPSRHKQGDVKFIRLPNGKIKVDGDADPALVARAITRAKEKRENGKRPIGKAKAAKVRDRMRKQLNATTGRGL